MKGKGNKGKQHLKDEDFEEKEKFNEISKIEEKDVKFNEKRKVLKQLKGNK